MSASFGIAMVGVAAMLAILGIAWRGYQNVEIGGLVSVALLSILASCLASHP